MREAVLCFIILFCIVQDTTEHTKTYLVETESDEVPAVGHGFKRSGKQNSGHGSDFGNPNPLRGEKTHSPPIYVTSPPKVPCTLWSEWSRWSGGSGCGAQQSHFRDCTCDDSTPPGNCLTQKQGGAKLGTPCFGQRTDLGSDYGNPNPWKGDQVPCSWNSWGRWSECYRQRGCTCDLPKEEMDSGRCNMDAYNVEEDWVEVRPGCESSPTQKKRRKYSEHGSDYGNPNPYGGNKPAPVSETASPPAISCKWGTWSKWGGGSGCGTKESRGRFCSCSDGSYGAPGRCGGGSTKDARPGTPCTQSQTPKGTPKPYRKKKRRM